MRKVLLATTALVAMTGAASAEVALSGYYEFGYTSVDDDLTTNRDTTFTEGEIHVNFSNVTDSGLSLGYHTEIVTHRHSAASTGNQIDDSYMSIAGDFGTLRLGENDTIESTFATYHPGGRNMLSGDDWNAQVLDADGSAVTTGLFSSATGGAYGDNANATYISPSMGGFTFGVTYAKRTDNNSGTAGNEYQTGSTTGDNEDSVIGVSYSTDVAGASVGVQGHIQDNGESGTDKTKKTAYGTNISFGDLSLAFSKVDYETSTTTDSDTFGYGIGYQVNDQFSVAVNIVDSEVDVSGTKDNLDTMVYSVSYDIAPGLNFAIALNNSDYVDGGDSTDNMKSDEMRASLQANF
jgi:outer membrane protein OmpU